MDRRAIFTPAFEEFLESQQRVRCQKRTQERFRQEDGSFKYAATEWRDEMEPSYHQEVIPTTLTEEDVHHDRWPVACYRFTLADGKVIETFPQQSRDFLSHNLTVDFMGLRRVLKAGETVILDELSWDTTEIDSYIPIITGNSQGRQRPIRGLEVAEPLPV